MPVSIYKKLFKDEDCTQIAPSKLQLATYTNKKVKIIGSCNLYIIHPDTRCLEETQFYVARNEGSTLISCATSLALSLIKPHKKLVHLPQKEIKVLYTAVLIKWKKMSANWKYSKLSWKQVHKKLQMDVPKENNLKMKTRTGQAESDMQPMKPKNNMWLNEPTMLIQHKILKKQGDDKNCQENINRRPRKSKMCSDKNCQEIKRPKKIRNVIWSVTYTAVQLCKPARLCSNKNC